jgi:hypothetical protein
MLWSNGFLAAATAVIPELGEVDGSPRQLNALRWTIAATSFLAIWNVGSFVTLPGAALSNLLGQALLREPSHLFHYMLLPTYLACILAACAAWPKRWRPSATTTVYCCWVAIVVSYFAAGVAKISVSGLAWFDGENVKRMFVERSLAAACCENWPGIMPLVGLPNVCFAVAGIAGVVAELAAPLMLVSRWARLVLPIVLIGFHIATLAFMLIPFPDLFIVPLVFWPPAILETPTRPELRAPVLLGVGMLAIALLRVEWFPLTSWAMFSERVDYVGEAHYVRVVAIEDNGTMRAQILDAISRRLRGADGRTRSTAI